MSDSLESLDRDDDDDDDSRLRFSLADIRELSEMLSCDGDATISSF